MTIEDEKFPASNCEVKVWFLVGELEISDIYISCLLFSLLARQLRPTSWIETFSVLIPTKLGYQLGI